jgi:signal transduction histidine kinase
MKLNGINDLNIGPRLKLTFAVLVAMILGGNGLLIWQFHLVRVQSERVTGVSQQLIAVLRLQQSLLSFHQELQEVAQFKDVGQLVREAERLRQALLEQTQRARTVLDFLPSGTPVDSAFLPTLDAIEITLPSQLQEITSLATSGDWEAVRLRLANELKPLESQTSALVRSIDQEVSAEMTQAVTNMTAVQGRVFLIVPATAVATFFIASFFGWTITRRILELRLEERVNERTRIARELHDTLLQGLFTVSLLLQDAVEKLPPDSPARRSFARVVQLTGQVIQEGRNAVRGFRPADRETHDLERAFSRIPEEIDIKEPVDFRVIVEGQPKSLHPAIRDDVYSIGREALVNSFRHSGASKIEVELRYSSSQLRVLVRDDGCGIDAKVLQSGRDGHWGLLGMRERAKEIGARVRVLSRAGAGTEVDLRVPSHIAFESRSSSPASGRITESG